MKHVLDLVILPRGSQCKIGQLINIEATRCLRRESWPWFFLRKESFPLSPKRLKQTKAKEKYDPYEILKKINDNVNMVNLLDDNLKDIYYG